MIGSAVALGFLAVAGEFSGTVQSTRLYTRPDPSAGGGIRARIVSPAHPILKVFAVPADDPKRVYLGQVASEGREVRFQGLPVGKYDLMVLYDTEFYEGFILSQEPDALTEADRTSIEKAIRRAVPFFEIKQIHRLEGATGREARARCVLQEYRAKVTLDQMGNQMKDIQIRSIKLAFIEDVGAVGWQLLNTREIVRQEVSGTMTRGLLADRFQPNLSGIRVIDTVKDLGELRLAVESASP